MSMPDRPIIAGGFYRSGTSLLRRLLDAHSRIHCGPEVKFFKDLHGDYRDDPLAHVRLFATLPSLGLTAEEIESIFGRAFVEAHELAARKAGKRRWADKNPENVLHLDAWQRLLPDGFVFIHVLRHPLDVLASLLEIGFPKAVPAVFADKVRLLSDFVAAGARFEAAHPDISYRLRYEDLVAEPDASLERLFAWLGERHEASVLTEFDLPIRGRGIEDPKVAGSRRVHDRSVGRWRADLSAEQVGIARSTLGHVFEGYQL